MITVFTRPGCMPCKATTRMLDQAGAPYELVDVSADPDAAKRLRDLGYQSTPVVEVRLTDGVDHWSGHRPENVRAAAFLATEGGAA